jgi:hypothetical protein
MLVLMLKTLACTRRQLQARPAHSLALLGLVGFCALLFSGCASSRERMITATAYCGCESCCEWERGSWKFLKLDFWNRYVSTGNRRGKPYTGRTASGTKPREPHEGLFTADSFQRPWTIPFKIILPWNIPSRDGTIAADTRYYTFGTRMNVPGWGWGVVEDRGGAIKGPDRIDLFHKSHNDALEWGRKTLPVEVFGTMMKFG